MKTLVITIDDKLHKEFKQVALDRDTSMKELVLASVKRIVQTHKRKAKG